MAEHNIQNISDVDSVKILNSKYSDFRTEIAKVIV